MYTATVTMLLKFSRLSWASLFFQMCMLLSPTLSVCAANINSGNVPLEKIFDPEFIIQWWCQLETFLSEIIRESLCLTLVENL